MTDGVPPDLQASGITKRFGQLMALRDVNFHLRAGQFHALLGENGAGKSTLVKCIMGYYHPDEGKILLDQQPVMIHSPRDAQTFGIGMVYQQFTLIPNMTVLENLVISKAKLDPVINWQQEEHQLAQFMEKMPCMDKAERVVLRQRMRERYAVHFSELDAQRAGEPTSHGPVMESGAEAPQPSSRKPRESQKRPSGHIDTTPGENW